jgi:hypothetical protein
MLRRAGGLSKAEQVFRQDKPAEVRRCFTLRTGAMVETASPTARSRLIAPAWVGSPKKASLWHLTHRHPPGPFLGIGRQSPV